MIETLVMRTEDNFHANSIGKCIHRPEAIAQCYVHGAALKQEYREEFIWDIRINHYQYRGRKDAFEKRCGIKIEQPEDVPTESLQCLQEDIFNRIEDRAIEQYIPQLKQEMSRPLN